MSRTVLYPSVFLIRSLLNHPGQRRWRWLGRLSSAIPDHGASMRHRPETSSQALYNVYTCLSHSPWAFFLPRNIITISQSFVRAPVFSLCLCYKLLYAVVPMTPILWMASACTGTRIMTVHERTSIIKDTNVETRVTFVWLSRLLI